jgi:hypothetical protein
MPDLCDDQQQSMPAHLEPHQLGQVQPQQVVKVVL